LIDIALLSGEVVTSFWDIYPGFPLRSRAERNLLKKSDTQNLNVSGGTTMKKTLAALALAGSLALVGTAPAIAANYPAQPNCVGVSDGTLAPGQTFTFSGTCFAPGEVITITVTLAVTPQAVGGGAGGVGMSVPSKITLPLAPAPFTTTADGNGDFKTELSIAEAGTYTVTATSATQSHSATVVVSDQNGTGLANTGGGAALANTGGGAALANTGADSGLVLWTLVGAGALAAGAASVVVVRRRAKAESAA
jgi:LPXTG-motif cell wall-anchored protein